MANVFNKIGDIKNDVKRNSFDWSHDNNFTTDLGRITPVFSELVPPNSSVRIKPEFGLRFMPMMFPIQTKMKAYLSFFKVPLRTLWKDYMDFISADNTEEYQPPFMVFSSNDYAEGGCLAPSGLGDYFGIPTSSIVPEIPVSYNPNISTLDPTLKTILRTAPYNLINAVPTAAQQQPYLHDASICNQDYNYAVIPFSMAADGYTPGAQYRLSFDLNFESSSEGFEQAFTRCAQITLYRVSSFVPGGNIQSTLLDTTYLSSNDLTVDRSASRIKYTYRVNVVAQALNTGVLQFYFYMLLPAYNGFINSDGTYLADRSITNIRVVSNNSGSSPYYGVFNTTSNSIKVSAYPFRAYESVYNAYIRNTRNNPFVLNGKKTYNRFITNDEGGEDRSTPKDLFYANWMSDAYTTALQSPQQGTAPLVGLTTYETTTLNEAGHAVTTVNTAIVDEEGNAYKVDFESNGEALKGVSYTPLKAGEAVNMQSLVSPVTSGISINDFRNVNAYQRYLELNQFRGFSYKEIIEGRFDVNVRYDALNMPEYLGGITRDVIVNPITQTVETSSAGTYQGALGSQAGLATCFGNSDGSISVFCDEESIILGVMYVVPMPVYDSVIPKWLTYRERLDSFNPEFDHIGYQPIKIQELAPVQAMANNVPLDTVFGYQRPWYEYVQKIDRSHGLFLTSLRNFIMYRSFSVSPELGKDFTTMKPGDVNNVFSVTEVGDKVLGQIHFNCTAQLPISRVVVPRLE